MWSECKAAAELANMIDALPAEMRVPVVHAAMRFEAEADFERAYLIGIYRSLLLDSMKQFAGIELAEPGLESVDPALRKRMEALAQARDLAQVQLAVCDLLELFAQGQEAS